jgi:hypothetical protein
MRGLLSLKEEGTVFTIKTATSCHKDFGVASPQNCVNQFLSVSLPVPPPSSVSVEIPDSVFQTSDIRADYLLYGLVVASGFQKD